MPDTLFKKTDYTLNHLLTGVECGDIGLPELQRPFVWKPVQVRDLFDSMYRGFPVGYLLFWSNAAARGAKQLGTQDMQSRIPMRLVVDGQQRLTALYAVLRGVPVLNHQFRQRHIKIAFHPREQRFEVHTPVHRRDPEWIPDISELWRAGRSSYAFIKQYLKSLDAHGHADSGDTQGVEHAVERLFDLQNYPFTALEIDQNVEEEQVGEIFVRINSKGVRLQQSDFILTLMSVYWDEGRRLIEEFCRQAITPSTDSEASPYTHVMCPEPDQMVRVLVGLALHRAVLNRVYGLLRGRDPDTREFSAESREQNFDALRMALPAVLDLTNWHEFAKCIVSAGYRKREWIMSSYATIFAYTIFLIGRTRHDMPVDRLRPLVARWFFAATVAARMTTSAETNMESLLRQFEAATSPSAFCDVVERDIARTLTHDFWTLLLPEKLATPAARSPAIYAFEAAQCVLRAPVLFSRFTIAELSDPAVRSKKRPLDRHHLFPRAHLKKIGFARNSDANQIANQALVEWPDNIRIGARPPAEYVAEIRTRVPEEQLAEMFRLHALPEGWYDMAYPDFLKARQRLMAELIHEAYRTLSGEPVAREVTTDA